MSKNARLKFTGCGKHRAADDRPYIEICESFIIRVGVTIE